MFRSARIQLTLAYTLVIALVMAAFSIALYLAISSGMSSNLEVPESSSPQVEKAILNAQLARARLALLGINIVGWAAAATASYVVAGRTLAPLEAALARQREFTAHASHELRTPLTIIKGEIDVTRSRVRAIDEYRETLDRIDEEVLHLDTTVADLLTLARLERGEHSDEREDGDVAEIVGDVLQPFHANIQTKEITLQFAVPPGLHASLDWTRIRRLLFNLVDNAVQHASQGGRIAIKVEPRGKFLDFNVFNTGPPIDLSDLPHIFTPFFRGKGAVSGTGTGLGLALCDWIARSHHGSVVARNEEGGVSFEVRLPRE